MAEDAQKIARRLLDQMTGYQTILEEMFAKLVKKVGGKMDTVGTFFQNLAGAGEALAKFLAKALVQKAVSAADAIVASVASLKDGIRLLRRLAKKIIGLLQRGMNNLRTVAGQVVKLMRRFRAMFMAVIESVMSLVATISPITALLSAINAVKRVLQAMFDWVGDVSPVKSVLEKLKKISKTFMKQLKSVKKELKPLPRQIRPLLAA